MLKIEVDGLKEFGSALKSVDMQRAIGPAHKRVADMVVQRAAPKASRATARRAIKPAGTRRAAKIRFTSGRRGDSLSVFLGQRQRSGWYGWRRYRGSSGRQFRRHLGNGWTIADLYDVGPTIMRSMDDAEDMFLDEIEDLARKAFPN